MVFIIEAPMEKTGNSNFENLELLPLSTKRIDEVSCISMRYNGKSGRLLNNEQFKISFQVKNRDSINFVFLFS